MSESGIVHPLIEDGKRNHYNLDLLGLDVAWLEKTLAQKGLAETNVFFLGQDDQGALYWIEKE